MSEPRITEDDRRIWSNWCQVAKLHSRTAKHSRRVDQAKRVIGELLGKDPDAVCMWSGGKDSTAMAHVAVSMNPKMPILSEKDDLDYPGELDYVKSLASQWEARLTVVVPDVSPSAWLEQHGSELASTSDVHARSAELSKACFYSVVERATAGRSIMLGLRSAESRGRRMNRASNGLLYRTTKGHWTATPLGDWEGIDVYSYLLVHEIPLLPLYQCVAFMHAHEPWTIRKSWWIPGQHSRYGGISWLRHYYPSLWRRLVSWIPGSQSMC